MSDYFDYITALQKQKEEIQNFFSGEYLSLQAEQIAIQYHLPPELTGEILRDLVLRGLKANDLEEIFDERKKIYPELSTEVLIDFYGKLFLPIDEHLKWNIKDILNSKGVDIKWYNDYRSAYEETLETERLGEFIEALRVNLDNSGAKEMENDIFESFQSNIVVELTESDGELVQSFNLKTIMLLYGVKGFAEAASKALINNHELLTAENLLLDEKLTQPSVANWFKDFFQVQGGGYFDALGLSKYLTTSSNVRKLNVNDRELVKKLLLTYRNLVNFKKIFETQTPEQWQIVPITQPDVFEELNKPIKNTSPKMIEKLVTVPAPVAISALRQPLKNTPTIQDIRPPAPMQTSTPATTFKSKTTPEQDRRIAELMAEAGRYPVGSLERRAVEGEIAKVESNR